jgi:hypothetical protein
MILDARGWKSEWKLKIILNGINNVKCHGLLHIVSIPNGHIPLGGSIGLYAFELDLI